MFLGKKNSNQNKYHSSNYISETKMKLSDETHSLQLNQYLFLKNCLLKRQIHRNLIVSREKKKTRSRERERRETYEVVEVGSVGVRSEEKRESEEKRKREKNGGG